MEELIKDVYEHNFYPGKNRLFKLVKKEDEDITKAEIVAFLDKQLEYQLTKVQNLQKHQPFYFGNTGLAKNRAAFRPKTTGLIIILRA